MQLDTDAVDPTKTVRACERRGSLTDETALPKKHFSPGIPVKVNVDSGGSRTGCVAYATDANRPVGDWKEGCEAAKKRAGVACRFHDLRHTGCTRMLEVGVPFSVVSEIMGWSPSTPVRMSKRYGHIGHSARRDAVDKLANATKFDADGAQKWAQSHSAGAQQVQ